MAGATHSGATARRFIQERRNPRHLSVSILATGSDSLVLTSMTAANDMP